MLIEDRSYRTEDEGAVAILAALVLTVLLLFSAFVIDIGALRADRAANQTVADLSAAAAVQEHLAFEAGSSHRACLAAKEYAERNLGLTLTPAPGGNDCEVFLTDFPLGDVCDPNTPLTAHFAADGYEVRISNPVLDAGDDSSGLMQSISHGASDGSPCDRVGVRVDSVRDFLLAPAGGSDRTQGSTLASAVAQRRFVDEPSDFASLIVLERQACQTLEVGGSGVLRVFDLVQGDESFPGTITVDSVPPSDAANACSNNSEIIDVSNNATLEAEGGIKSFALSADADPNDPSNNNTYSDDRVAGDSIIPRPEAGPDITRSIIDHVYNCRTDGYNTVSAPWAPGVGGQPIEPCPEETAVGGEPVPAPPAYIELLDNAVADVMSGNDAGWSVIGDDADDDVACDATDGLNLTGDRWIVRCSETFGPGDLTFTDVEHIIFANGFESGSGDNLYIDGSDDVGTVVSMADGGLESSQGRIRMRNTFVYIRTTDTGQSGRINVSGSTDQFSLQAPLDDAHCATPDGRPLASCFSPLAVWSNYVGTFGGNNRNRVAGDASGGIIGTVFTPNAQFRFRGSGDETPSNCGSVGWADLGATTSTLSLEGAQFFARRIDIAGSAEIGMCPSPDTTVPTNPEEIVRLIR